MTGAPVTGNWIPTSRRMGGDEERAPQKLEHSHVQTLFKERSQEHSSLSQPSEESNLDNRPGCSNFYLKQQQIFTHTEHQCNSKLIFNDLFYLQGRFL